MSQHYVIVLKRGIISHFEPLFLSLVIYRKFQGAMQIVAMAETVVRIFGLEFMNIQYIDIICQVIDLLVFRYTLTWMTHQQITGFAY